MSYPKPTLHFSIDKYIFYECLRLEHSLFFRFVCISGFILDTAFFEFFKAFSQLQISMFRGTSCPASERCFAFKYILNTSNALLKYGISKYFELCFCLKAMLALDT